MQCSRCAKQGMVEIRMKIADSLQRIVSILAFSDHLQVRECGEQGTQALARRAFVIYNQYAHQSCPPLLMGNSMATRVMPAGLRPMASRPAKP